MSEFDLVEPSESRPTSHLKVSTRQLGSVLEVWLGEPCWEDRPAPSEIPGWRDIPVAPGGELNWDPACHRMAAGETEIFTAHAAPLLRPVTPSELPGLLIRRDDTLPAGFDTCVVWKLQLAADTQLYGLGQRSGPLERTGLTATNWTTDNPTGHNRNTDPLYQAHPVLWGVTDEVWWALSLCHTSYSRFDLGQSHTGVLEIQALGASLCLHLHHGSSPHELLGSLRQTLETPELPPLWALGFHQSRWGYKDADEITDLVESFRSLDLPLDVVHLDIDHMRDYRSFTFDPVRFSEPEKRIADWREQGVRVVTIIDPGLKFDPSKGYSPLWEGLEGDHFLKSASGAPVTGYCWPDEALFPDFSRSETRDWWARRAEFYLDRGVAGLWIDMNEPAIFDKPFWSGGARQHPMPLDTPGGEDAKRLNQAGLHNLYGSHMSQATHGAWKGRGERPWVLTRAAFSGCGHYAWSWMGDNTSWWEHLALSLPQLSSMGLVNSAFVGVDVGGFFGNCSADLYSAWIETSVIYPFMRAHSALGTEEQHPWSYGDEVLGVARRALRLRYRLLPYIYSAAASYCEGGPPLLRPLFFDFPIERRFRYTEDQVMFGPHIMACPFLVRGQDERMVRMPEGDWYEFYSGAEIPGSGSFVIERDAGHLPLFVKAGAVIPMLAEQVRCTDEAHRTAWDLCYFPGEVERESRLYWDAGDGTEYRSGERLTLTLGNRDRRLEVLEKSGSEACLRKQVRITRASDGGWVGGELREFGAILSE